jgi:hypothetical protein
LVPDPALPRAVRRDAFEVREGQAVARVSDIAVDEAFGMFEHGIEDRIDVVVEGN